MKVKSQIGICIFIFLSLIFYSNSTSSQTLNCEIIGRLLDSVTGETISNAEISSEPGNNVAHDKNATTDTQGNFKLMGNESELHLYLTLKKYESEIPISHVSCGIFQIYYAVPIAAQLNEVAVTGFRNDTKKEKIPASIGYVDRKTIESTDQTSLQNAVNTIPGVIMESRGFGGSHRLSIRGSSLRSPFAVRNIKMYLEGIPLTSPDGQAPLEMIDAADITGVEIIKGPAGSVYGSGNGGIMLFKAQKAGTDVLKIGGSFQVASYNTYRSTASADIGFRNGGLHISHVWQDNAGYRSQEFNHKNQVSLSYNQFISAKQKIFVYGTYYKGNWGLPGALTDAQIEKDPTQAVAFSVTNNAKLLRDRLYGGVSHSIQFGMHFKETTSAYYYTTKKLNPYGTSSFNSGYKDESADGYGGRTDWMWDKNFSDVNIKVNFGGEWQTEKYNILEDKIKNSQPDAFKYFYDIGYTTTMAFASSDIAIKDLLTFNVGASLNNTKQDVEGFNSDNFNFDTTATWNTSILPRIAASFKIMEGLYIFQSVSAGNSNPTVFEMIDSENNNYNLSLRPESGLNREGGIKQSIPSINLKYELAAYHFVLNNAILSYSQVVGEDTKTLYHNVGSTNQKGLEWSASWTYQPDHEFLTTNIWTSGSAYFYSFADYKTNDVQLIGNKIPGVPKMNTSSGISFVGLRKIKLDIMHYWFDKTPLDNANTTWSNPYHLLNARIGYQLEIAKVFQVNIHAGANNILNAKYSSFYALNGTAGKYYNPSAPMNYYFGVSFSYVPKLSVK